MRIWLNMRALLPSLLLVTVLFPALCDGQAFASKTGEDDKPSPQAGIDMEKRLNQAIRTLVGDHAVLIEDNLPLLQHCRKASEAFLTGQALREEASPWLWGAGELNSFSFEKMEEVLQRLTEKIGTEDSSWMLGVDSRRSEAYPGGIYAVTLVTFARKPQAESTEKLLLELLNQRREAEGLPPLIWSTLLIRPARVQLRQFKATRKIHIPSKGLTLYYAYETPDIETIPGELLARLEQDSIREIGICLIKVKSDRFQSETYLVSLVGK